MSVLSKFKKWIFARKQKNNATIVSIETFVFAADAITPSAEKAQYAQRKDQLPCNCRDCQNDDDCGNCRRTSISALKKRMCVHRPNRIAKKKAGVYLVWQLPQPDADGQPEQPWQPVPLRRLEAVLPEPEVRRQ